MRERLLRGVLVVGLIGALGISGYHAFRAVRDAIYWNVHKDEPIEGWMTLGYVAHSYHVPPHVIFLALGMQPGPPERRNLATLAAARGQSLGQVSAVLAQAIVHARPPYPPPAPPPRPNGRAAGR